MAVHYEGVDTAEVGHDRCAAKLRQIQRFHMDTRGWSDIAYSWAVCRHGRIWELRGWGVRTAANGTDEGNDGYHAVCYLDDDGSGTDLTAAADAALGEVVRECQRLKLGSEVRPHGSFKPTSCPGEELRQWISRKGWTLETPVTPARSDSKPVKAVPNPITPPGWYRRLLEAARPLLRGEDVKTVQRKLRVDPDGLYGPDTQAKVRGWQKLHGLPVDGKVGPATARSLGD